MDWLAARGKIAAATRFDLAGNELVLVAPRSSTLTLQLDSSTALRRALGEGRIALAHRRKDPLLLFAALQRHLNYPTVPRPARPDEQKNVVPLLIRRVERLEQRLKLVEEEQRGGIDLSKFMRPPSE